MGIRPVWSEPSLSALKTKLGSLANHWAHSEYSDQTGRMPRLIWVFAGRICHFEGFVKRWLKYNWSYTGKATITGHSLFEAPKEEEVGTNNEKTQWHSCNNWHKKKKKKKTAADEPHWNSPQNNYWGKGGGGALISITRSLFHYKIRMQLKLQICVRSNMRSPISIVKYQ